MLTHFNKNKAIPKELTASIEHFYEYYWAHDKNYAIKSGQNLVFMEGLPNHIRTDIYTRFLFADFIYMFRMPFRMTKETDELQIEKEI